MLALSLAGCTAWFDYVRQGFKVGPEYAQPPAPVAQHWIDAADQRVRSQPGLDDRWWTVLGDPVLNDLVQVAYRQNLTVREACCRVLESRAPNSAWPLGRSSRRRRRSTPTTIARASAQRWPTALTCRKNSSASGISASIWPGSWIFGVGSVGQSRPARTT